ncbi:MAG: hypothetical protein ABI378_05475, partial [Chitinophagaceae bacterium]
ANTKLIIKKEKGTEKIPLSSVLGWSEKSGKQFRIYEGISYRILQQDTFTLYVRRRGERKVYYYSQGVCNQIQPLKTIEKTLKNSNPKFLALLKKDLRWYQPWLAYDDSSKSYKIILIYKRSLGQ